MLFTRGEPEHRLRITHACGFAMTQLLEEAFRAAAQLPAADQDVLAEIILAELSSEVEWDRQFAATADQLAALADEAHAEYVAGRTEPLDPDRL